MNEKIPCAIMNSSRRAFAIGIGVGQFMASQNKNKDKTPKLYFDMDNVLVDFQSGVNRTDEATLAQYEEHWDDIPGIFAKMDPMPGAIDAVHQLAQQYDCYILSTAPWKNPSAWSDKVEWVTKHLDDVFHKKIILTHNKELLNDGVSYLIDDNTKHGASDFGERHIQFGSEKFPNWDSVLNYLP